MQTKSQISSLLACAAVAFALACSAALLPILAFGETTEIYNLTVGNTLVGKDSSRWQGEGESRSYVYNEGDLSYTFYPSTSTLQLNGGTITGYYVYNDGTKDVEVGSVVSTNCVPVDSTITNIDTLTIEVTQDTEVLISQHAPTNVDPSARAFADNTQQTSVSATICGPGTLSISTDGTLDSCSVSGFIFKDVTLSENIPAHIVFDSIHCACNSKDGFCSFTGIEGNQQTSIGQDCTVEFNTIEIASAGIAEFVGITGAKTVVGNNAQVILHNLDYSCSATARIGYTHVALFHVFGNFTSTGDIRMAPDADDAVNISLANASEDGHEKIVVAGIAADYQAGDANVCVSGTFIMNNVTLAASASTSIPEEGEVFFTGIHNGSTSGTTSLTDLNFVFNEYGKSSISIGGKSTVRLMVRAVDESRDLKTKNSTFNITLPKVDATYLCSRSNVAGLMSCTDGMALSDSIIDVCYSDINVDDTCTFLGHAGLVAAGRITIDGLSRYAATCTETGEMTGIEARSVYLADDTLLEIQAPSGQPAIAKSPNNANDVVYAHVGDGAEQIHSAQTSLENSNNANIVQLAEEYAPYISYGPNAQSAATATALEPDQYGENPFFAIANRAYDYHVSFDSMGGSTVETQTIHNLALAIRPTDPLKDGYSFEGWYTDAECTELYDFDTPVTEDITLYAKWKVNGTIPATGDSNAPAIFLILALAGCAYIVAAKQRKTLRK